MQVLWLAEKIRSLTYPFYTCTCHNIISNTSKEQSHVKDKNRNNTDKYYILLYNYDQRPVFVMTIQFSKFALKRSSLMPLGEITLKLNVLSF